jgi:glycosyltransferase involved in cell wall biosynthesis
LGFVDDPADPQQLQAAMQAWLQAPDLRQQAGRWLRRRIEQEFDWSRVCEDFERLYDRLLSNPQVQH